jgi:DNA-binding MurR/RpiR family transcriptional regulator
MNKRKGEKKVELKLLDINSISEPKNIVPLVKSVYNSLTKSEKKVADLVIKGAETLMYASISDFAEIAGVGDTTILRFCRKIGFKAYQGFKLAIAQECAIVNTRGIKELNNCIVEDDNLTDIIQKTYATDVSALEETVGLLRVESVEEAVSLISRARNIHVYGSGLSGITALAARNKFLRIGLNIFSDTDTHNQAMTASLLTREDLAIGFSFSGSSIDTVNHLRLAKTAGARTICITHHANSPITKTSDVTLLTGAKESPLQGGAVSAQIAQLLVIDILYNATFLKLKEQSVRNKEKTARAVLDKLY